MTRRQYPEFHKMMMDQDSYPEALRRPKFEETTGCYFYRTGNRLYKIRKTSPIYNNLAIKERYGQEAVRLCRFWNPDLEFELLPLVSQGDEKLSLGGEGSVVDYALQITQLSDHYWLDRQLSAGKITPTGMGRLARYLAQHHLDATMGDAGAETGRPENFLGLAEEAFYQSKKYLGQTITEPMLEMITRPVNKFLYDERKLFTRRVKKGRIVDGHGAFVPEHIFIRSSDIHALSPLDSRVKFRVLDAANDVACLVNELLLKDAAELAEVFIKRYGTASKDRDLHKLLPLYQTLQAAHRGVMLSEQMKETVDEESKTELKEHASQYFNLAVKVARQINRPA